jgi:hypothetical protein
MLGIKKKKTAPDAATKGKKADRRVEDNSRAAGADEQARIDEAIAASFPASDPPAWNMGDDRAAKPNRRKARKK